MFDISFTQILVIGAVALLVIGPERLPKVARTAGHLLGRMQRYVATVKADINREMEMSELRDLQNLKKEVETIQTEVNAAGEELARSVTDNVSLAQKHIKEAEEQLRSGFSEPSATPAPSAAPEAQSPSDGGEEPRPQLELGLDGGAMSDSGKAA